MSVAEKTERKVVTPDVYGNTPFQHEVTAEPTKWLGNPRSRAGGKWLPYRIGTNTWRAGRASMIR
jgi:hypothetical protein